MRWKQGTHFSVYYRRIKRGYQSFFPSFLEAETHKPNILLDILICCRKGTRKVPVVSPFQAKKNLFEKLEEAEVEWKQETTPAAFMANARVLWGLPESDLILGSGLKWSICDLSWRPRLWAIHGVYCCSIRTRLHLKSLQDFFAVTVPNWVLLPELPSPWSKTKQANQPTSHSVWTFQERFFALSLCLHIETESPSLVVNFLLPPHQISLTFTGHFSFSSPCAIRNWQCCFNTNLSNPCKIPAAMPAESRLKIASNAPEGMTSNRITGSWILKTCLQRDANQLGNERKSRGPEVDDSRRSSNF